MTREKLVADIIKMMTDYDLTEISFFGRCGKWHNDNGIKYELKEFSLPDIEKGIIETTQIPSYSFVIEHIDYNIKTMHLSKLKMLNKMAREYIKSLDW